MEPHTQASAELFGQQMKAERAKDMALFKNGAISEGELVRRTTRTEFANGFEFHPTRPNTMRAVGTGPGLGGLHVGQDKPGGHSGTVQGPLPKNHPNMVVNMHSHGNPRPNKANDYPSFTDLASGAHERSQFGVPTQGVIPTKTRLDLQTGNVSTVKTTLLYNGHVPSSRSDGALGKNDLPGYYRGTPNSDIVVGPPSPGLSSISWEEKKPAM